MTVAAQYVRMSTEEQEYSIINQKAAIAEYARENGFTIIRTYEDPGESGLTLNHRPGLRQLLADVVSHTAPYEKILVLDVSRWGRFQDPDEAAHYEFICKKAGIGVVYCAESFHDRNTVSDYFLKILKRTSAAEYSHELSIKTFESIKRVIELGFRAGGPAPFGYRRMAVSADGRPKRLLQAAESKILISDRVTLVLGPTAEVNCVRSIFKMCARHKSLPEIAVALNKKGLLKGGRQWKASMVDNIVKNGQYTGTCIWNKTSTKLGTKATHNPTTEWLVRVAAFPPIISQDLYDRARRQLRKRGRWNDWELIDRLKRLYKRKGYLSQRLIGRTIGMPALSTLARRLGPLSQIYAMVGFDAPPDAFLRPLTRRSTTKLRAGLIRQVLALFPEEIQTFQLPRKHRLLLRVKGEPVSILFCRDVTKGGNIRYWSLDPAPSEAENVTLLCRLNSSNDGFFDLRLLPRLGRRARGFFTERHAMLALGERLHGLEDLCKAVARQCGNDRPQVTDVR